MSRIESVFAKGDVKGRGSVSPALSFSRQQFYQPTNLPNIPRLSGHTLYMVTPGGSEGISRADAIEDIISMSSWLVAAISATPDGHQHCHYLALLPESCENWLSKTKESVWRNWRRLPQVVYSRGGTIGACRVTFSKVFDVGGCLNYLTGPRNRATFVTLLDISPRLHTPVPGSLYNINTLHLPPSLLLDGIGVEPWECDAGAAQKAALLRSGTAPRLDGEKKIAEPLTATPPPHRRPGGSGRCDLDVFRLNGCGFPHGDNDKVRIAPSIQKQRPPCKLSLTGRLINLSTEEKDSVPVYVPHVSGYI